MKLQEANKRSKTWVQPLQTTSEMILQKLPYLWWTVTFTYKYVKLFNTYNVSIGKHTQNSVT